MPESTFDMRYVKEDVKLVMALVGAIRDKAATYWSIGWSGMNQHRNQGNRIKVVEAVR